MPFNHLKFNDLCLQTELQTRILAIGMALANEEVDGSADALTSWSR
jgi:hypothetical protein